MGFLADDEFGFSVVDEPTDEFGNGVGTDTAPFNSDVLIRGAANAPPSVSDFPETSKDTPFGGLTKLLGSIGSTARDVGTAVGTLRRDLKAADVNYRTAQRNAYTGNTVGQWWQYSSTMDKVMVGLAVLVIAVVVIKR